MGLFDYVRCLMLLPDGRDGSTMEFQTKDAPAQYMVRYEIRPDGQLWGPVYESLFDGRSRRRMVPIPFEGSMRLYTNNITTMSLLGVITDDGGAPREWLYTALFREGQVWAIGGGEHLLSE